MPTLTTAHIAVHIRDNHTVNKISMQTCSNCKIMSYLELSSAHVMLVSYLREAAHLKFQSRV